MKIAKNLSVAGDTIIGARPDAITGDGTMSFGSADVDTMVGRGEDRSEDEKWQTFRPDSIPDDGVMSRRSFTLAVAGTLGSTWPQP